MGNGPSLILKGICFDGCISKHLAKINQNQKSWKYVDDNIIITKMNKTELDEYFEQINTIRSKIRYGTEFDEKNKRSFISVSATRDKLHNKIDTKWLRNEIAVNKLSNYHWSYSKSVWRNLVSTMVSRIKNTTKKNEDQKEDIDKYKQILRFDYPETKIQEIIRTTLSTQGPMRKLKQEKDEELKHPITLPHTPEVKVLKRKVSKIHINLF